MFAERLSPLKRTGCPDLAERRLSELCVLPGQLRVSAEVQMAIGSEMQGFQLRQNPQIHPCQSGLRRWMKLGQFDQREQTGGMGCQSQIRIAQIQQLRSLVLQVGQINPAFSGLGESLVGIARKAQIARWARMAQDPARFAAPWMP